MIHADLMVATIVPDVCLHVPKFAPGVADCFRLKISTVLIQGDVKIDVGLTEAWRWEF